jgi:hypothetical protein
MTSKEQPGAEACASKPTWSITWVVSHVGFVGFYFLLFEVTCSGYADLAMWGLGLGFGVEVNQYISRRSGGVTPICFKAAERFVVTRPVD